MTSELNAQWLCSTGAPALSRGPSRARAAGALITREDQAVGFSEAFVFLPFSID